MAFSPEQQAAAQAALLKSNKTSVDGLSIDRGTVHERIALDRYIAQCEASSNRTRPFRMSFFVPPGSVNDSGVVR